MLAYSKNIFCAYKRLLFINKFVLLTLTLKSEVMIEKVKQTKAQSVAAGSR